MPVKWIWTLAVVLLGLGLWVHPGAAGKIQQFKDDQGTLHINNAGQEGAAKAEKEEQPGRRRRSVYPVPAPVAAPPPEEPEPVAAPAAEEATQEEAAGGVPEEAAPTVRAPRGGQSDSGGRPRGGRR